MTTEKSFETGKVVFGRVKWFNPKSGYGFITICNTSDDVFVHHNAIKVSSNQYKYLVLGEYVQLLVVENDSGKYKYSASEVCGIYGGILMCESRNDSRESKNLYKKNSTETSSSLLPEEESV